MHRKLVTTFVVLLLGALGILAGTPAQAVAGQWVQCRATGSVALFTDASRATLVDAFTFTDAPAQQLANKGHSDIYVLGTGQNAPGVSVTGAITGSEYTFRFKSVTVGNQTPSGTTQQVGFADWRVTASNGGIVSDSRNHRVGVWTEDGHVVSHFFGPTEHGLFLSGGIGIFCP
jgi:hypothetical protein